MEDNTVQVDLKGAVKVVLDNAVVIIAITLIFATVSLIFTKVCIPKKYTSSVSLYVMNNKATQNTGEILSSDISASQMLVNTYAVILSDNLVMEDIGKILLKKYGEKGLEGILPVLDSEQGKYIPSDSIASCISMGSVNDTEVLQIRATTRDPQVSVDVCLAMSEVAPENVSKNVILGGFFGFVLSIGLVFALKFLNNTVDDEETLRNKFGIPVLGEIPVYTANESEGANNV